MKTLLLSVLALAGGIGVGGGAAYGTGLLLDGDAPLMRIRYEFVPTGPILAPLVFADGRLSGYVSFQAQLEIADTERDRVLKRLPLLLDAVNMRTYRTPMASGRDGLVPGLETFRKLLMDAAAETYGRDVVRRAVITQASPI